MHDGIGREFMERTRYRQLGPSDQQRGEPSPPVFFTSDRAGRRVPLPPAVDGKPGAQDLYRLITERRSRRRFRPAHLSQAHLSFLLWSTQGVKETLHEEASLRTVPSAGARHALETYLMINRVEGITGDSTSTFLGIMPSP